ncbi:molecular chaperone DnaJ [Clostridium sp.]|uniref:molecular chaperone DnaJ n=1 Tax=Clostridium sp. TaxID=1506 RepID=UPI0025B937D1|nr:molecular chaperone DnaJ [Clostridium sp.]
MEQYKILGVDENASIEEIKIAYENKVNKLKEEVSDEKRAKAFIKVFDKAYEEIKLEREKNKYKENFINDSNKNSLNDNYKNNFKRDNWHNNNFEYDDEKEETKKKKKIISSNNSSFNKQKSDKKKLSKNRNNESNKEKYKRDNTKKVINRERSEEDTVTIVIQILLKIIALPVIALLSIIIFSCKVINLISWIATKVIIIGAIAIASIHGYQVYIGQPVYYEVFVLCAVAFVVSLFLPSILKIVPSILGKINNKLKDFIF